MALCEATVFSLIDALVNMASLLGTHALPGDLACGASGAALLQISRFAAMEFARAGEAIRFNSILPAVTETPMVLREIKESARAGTFGTHDEGQARNELRCRLPMRRLGQRQDVGDAALYLASSESAFLTGTQLAANGCRSAL